MYNESLIIGSFQKLGFHIIETTKMNNENVFSNILINNNCENTPPKDTNKENVKKHPISAAKSIVSKVPSTPSVSKKSKVGLATRTPKQNSSINITTPKATITSTKKRVTAVKTPPNVAYLCSNPSSPSLNSSFSTSTSVREAARLAKLQCTAEKVRQVSALKEKWNVELQERKNATNFEEKEKERRRKSVALNNEIHRKAKENESKILLQLKQNEIYLLASRRDDHIQVQEYKQMEQKRKRESMIGRGIQFHKQKQVELQLQSIKEEEDKSILQLRHQNWQDEQQYKQQQKVNEQQDLQLKSIDFSKQKEIITQQEIQQQNQLSEEMNKRHSDWIDIQKYKKAIENKSRLSMAGRISKWREEKTVEMKLKEDQEIAKEMDILLKTQELEDVQSYQEKLKAHARKSLCYRLDKSKKDNEVVKKMHAIEKQIEEENRQLYLEDRLVIQTSFEHAKKAARESLLQHHEFELKDRQRKENELKVMKENEINEIKLKFDDWKIIQQHEEIQKELHRKSLINQMIESRHQQEIDMTNHRLYLDKIHLEIEERHQFLLDQEKIKKSKKENSRKSICIRLESWRHQRMAEEMLVMKQKFAQQEEAELARWDRIAMETAKEALQEEMKEKFKNTKLNI